MQVRVAIARAAIPDLSVGFIRRLAWQPTHRCEELLRLFNLRNFRPCVEADEGWDE